MRQSAAILAGLLLLATLCSGEVEFGDVNSLLEGGSGKKDKDIVPARKEDIKYIRCGVCMKLAEEAVRAAQELRQSVSHISKVSAAPAGRSDPARDH
jgi:hypothetical protein